MMINKRQFLQILKKYNSGNASKEEEALINSYYDLFEGEPEITDLLSPEERIALKNKIGDQLFAKIDDLRRAHTLKSRQYRWWLAAAASIVIVCALSLYFYQQTKVTQPIAAQLVDVKPGGNKAVLTLADGSKVMLGNSEQGILANQSNAVISGSGDGQIRYETTSSSATPKELIYNTLETPSGGQFELILPDGSRVWLNAESSIRYPAVFPDKERVVEVKGEVYFEIAKDKHKPFRVLSGQQQVEVLGTHFNINAYSNESLIRTTLLEGSVKVSAVKGNKVAYLKPGQQSRLMLNNDLKVVSEVDLEETVGWRHGMFQFNGTDLKAIMRQLSRWYDVDVDVSNFPEKEFVGVISRNVPLSKVLQMLELTSNLKFKIVSTRENGGRRIIMPK